MASPPPAAPSHPYTCNTCMVAFKGSDLQRRHMQSDWHRYNLKRRVASLPPLTSEIFTEKVLANQATAAATAARASFEKVCAACQRTYFSENAYQNHLGSQKHKAKVAQLSQHNGSVAEDETTSMVSSAFSLGDPLDSVSTTTIGDERAKEEFSQIIDGIQKAKLGDKEPLPRPGPPTHSAAAEKLEHPLSPSEDDQSSAESEDEEKSDSPDAAMKCLFCSLKSMSLDENVSHMKTKHGLFIPEQAYLVDLDGLVRWLHDRVSFLHECLYCGMIRHTKSGIQTHMRDKGHCMIAFESEAQMVEVGQFYDFRSTYSDDEEEDEDEDEEGDASVNAKPRLGARRQGQTIEVDGDDDMEDDDWEDEDDEDDEMDEDTTAPPSKRRRPRAAEPQAVYHDEDGLHLPSGRLAGHRSLARYYRQNLHSYPTPEERVARRAIADAPGADDDTESNGTLTPTGQRNRRQNAVTRANGGLGMLGVSDTKKREVAAVEKADQKRAQRQQNKYQWGNDKRGNSQKHFRDPLLQ